MKYNISPDPFESEIRMARNQLQADRLTDAEQTFRDVLDKDPMHPAANFGLGTMLNRAGQHEAAIEHLQATVTAWPHHLESRFFLAVSLWRLQRLEESAGHYKQIIRDHPDVAEVHNNLGIVKAQLALDHEVEEHFLQALKLRPSFAETHKNLGTLYREEGRIDEARDHLRQAIASQPHFAEAYFQFTSITKFTEYDDDIHEIESSYRRDGVSDIDKMKLAYSLGKVCHDLRQYPRAFQYWCEANRLRRELSNYEADPTPAEMCAMKEIFSAAFCARADRTRITTPTLLFVVGMPRSGTTLTEQILASHSTVYGAGELDALDFAIRGRVRHFPADLGTLNRSDWAAIGERYRKEILDLAGNAACVSDKLPGNFLHIGAISLMFPDAKIIHCRRDPMDTGLSCFRNYFVSDRLGFTSDLTDLGRHYRHYLDLMTHWNKVPTARIYDIRYEALVTNPEREVRKLLEFCELPYESRCLAFHETERSIKSASAAQVRQPIYRDSLEGWKHYEDELQPFKTALEEKPGHLASFVANFLFRFRGSSR